jgi:hypothetical protein
LRATRCIRIDHHGSSPREFYEMRGLAEISNRISLRFNL